MMDSFDVFVSWLDDRLKAPLPGKTAQMKMKPRNIDPSNFTIKPTNNPKVGSVLILLYPKNNRIFIALMKRPDYEGVHGGQISFPGGKREETDANLVQTALREGEEEVGIISKDVSIVGLLSEHFVFASNFNVLPVVGYLKYTPEFHPDHREVEKVVEVGLDHLLDKKNQKEINLTVRKNHTLLAPYFDVDGHIVWGATAMILSEFLTITKEFKF